MKRYNLEQIETGIGVWEEWVERPDGDWVRWEDAQALLAEVETLRQRVNAVQATSSNQ